MHPQKFQAENDMNVGSEGLGINKFYLLQLCLNFHELNSCGYKHVHVIVSHIVKKKTYAPKSDDELK